MRAIAIVRVIAVAATRMHGSQPATQPIGLIDRSSWSGGAARRSWRKRPADTIRWEPAAEEPRAYTRMRTEDDQLHVQTPTISLSLPTCSFNSNALESESTHTYD